MNPIEHLAETAWRHPKNYGGFSPDGDYVIATQHRDSDALARSNWSVLAADLGAEAYTYIRANHWSDDSTDYEDRPTVYHWRASHWAVGWVEYLMVRADAPEDVLTNAGEWLSALADYPVADDDHFSELEFTEACAYWANCSVADRLDAIKRSDCRGVSRFAARRDSIPSDDNGALLHYLICA